MFCRYCSKELSVNNREYLKKGDLDKSFLYTKSYRCECGKTYNFPEDRISIWEAGQQFPTKEKYEDKKEGPVRKDQISLL